MTVAGAECCRLPRQSRRRRVSTLALGRTLVAAGRMGVPSGASTRLALPQALLPDMADMSGFGIPEAKDRDWLRLGRDCAVPKPN